MAYDPSNKYRSYGAGFPSNHTKAAIIPYDTTSAALQEAHDYCLENGASLDLAGQTYNLTTRVSLKPHRVIIEGGGATLSGTGMTDNHLIYMEAVAADPSFDQMSHSMRNVTIAGPDGTADITGILWSGSTSARSVRPTFYNINTYGFGRGIDLVNYAYLGGFERSSWRNCKIAIRQSAGTDAGENCALSKCLISLCDLGFHLLDGSSEWFVSKTSFDYMDQLVVAQGAPSRLHLDICHIEPRGANDGSGYYMLNGSGTDPRAPVAGRDTFIDIDGNGSYFLMTGGWFDINNSGGVGPYAYEQIVNVRNNNSNARFENVSMQNMANTSNKFWTGTGQCVVRGLQHQVTPSMPTRISDQTFGNALRDGGIEDATIPDLWYVSKDTAAITNRLTGTNITLARSTVQKRTGASSMLITKVAAGNGQVSILIPVRQGDRCSVAGYSYLNAAAGGSIFADCRWANVLGLDANGVPIIQSAAGVSFHSSTTLSATTGSFQAFEMKTYDNGASGEPCAPSWATHLRVSFNLDGVSVAGTLLYIDDISISVW